MIITLGNSDLEMRKFDIEEHIDYSKKLDKCLQQCVEDNMHHIDLDIPSPNPPDSITKSKTLYEKFCGLFSCFTTIVNVLPIFRKSSI